jgi:type I restriction enzyme, S subunit
VSLPHIDLFTALESAEVFVDGDWVESKDQDPDGDVRLIQLADVGDGVYVDKSSRFLTAAKARALKCTFLKGGDVLVARMPDPLGRACIFPGDPKTAVTVVDVCIIRPRNDTHDPRWLTYTLNTPSCRQQIAGFATGTTRSRISRSNLGKVKIPVLPLPEQRRIAEVLDRAEALRAKRRAALAQLDTLTQSIFLDLFGDPACNPMGWPRTRLGDLIIVGPQNGLYKPSTDYGSGTPILRIDAFYDGAVTKLGILKRVRLSDKERELYELRSDDIVVNRVNSMEYLGKSALIPKLDEPTVFESNMMRFEVDRQRVEPRYAVEFLQSMFVKGQILTAAKHAVNQSSINQQDVQDFRINVPPIKVQREFTRSVASVEKLGATQHASLSELDALFAVLQHRAFRGEL